GQLPGRGPPGGLGQGVGRRGGSGAGVGGPGAAGAADGRGGGRAGPPGGGPAAGAVAGPAAGAGRRGPVLRAPRRPPGVCGAAGVGPVDRQRVGGGGVQASDRATDEADGGAVAGAPGQPDGDAVLHVAWRHLGPVLEATTQLTPESAHAPVAAGSTGYALDQARFLQFFESYWTDHPTESLDLAFVRLYQMYHRRAFFGIGHLHPKYHGFFAPTPIPDGTVVRVGLEFETGNIASSFRALWKLNILYLANLLDAGVFITSLDKTTTAARIWPQSNRNGSFTELEQRNY